MKTLDYQFKDIPLTALIGKHLILEIYTGKIDTRQNIISTVTEAHIARGGKKTNASDNTRMLKTALNKLKKEGLAKNPSYGYWEIINLNEKNEVEVNDNEVEVNEVSISNSDSIKRLDTGSSEELKEKYNADVVLGTGDSFVYLYYLPIYRENREKDTWACKIGRTNIDPLQRISSQASTALPEKPKVAVIIKTDNSPALEQAIHNILTYRKKKIETGMGQEWFDTNPDEFLKIVQFIEQSTLLF